MAEVDIWRGGDFSDFPPRTAFSKWLPARVHRQTSTAESVEPGLGLSLQSAYENAIAGDGGSFIAGLGGNDWLFGGAGADTFYFNSRTAGVDTIWNFSEAQGDNIIIQGSAFAAPAGFRFTDGVGFVQGTNAKPVAQTATFAYDISTGYLWYDPDGIGAASSRTLVAFLPGAPVLHAADFSVV